MEPSRSSREGLPKWAGPSALNRVSLAERSRLQGPRASEAPERPSKAEEQRRRRGPSRGDEGVRAEGTSQSGCNQERPRTRATEGQSDQEPRVRDLNKTRRMQRHRIEKVIMTSMQSRTQMKSMHAITQSNEQGIHASKSIKAPNESIN